MVVLVTSTIATSGRSTTSTYKCRSTCSYVLVDLHQLHYSCAAVLEIDLAAYIFEIYYSVVHVQL